MPCCCHSVNKRIIIVRGDDTDFNDRTLLTLRLSSDVLDLSTFKATLTLFSLVREYDDLTQNLTVNYSAEETMTLPYGNITGVLRLYDTRERVDTIETNIPFQVISEVEAREIELRDSYYSVEITDGEETILNIAIESAISVRIGQVQTLQPDEPAYVTNMGSNNHLVLNFGIPQGIKGDRGEKGDTGENGQDGRDGTDGRSAEMRIGAVETLQPTQNAYVINTGTSLNAVFDFGIPKGDKGDKGDTGDTGDTGEAATIQIGTVTTLSPSQTAYVENVGTEENAIFNFGIPKGDTGSGANADFSDITGSPYDCDALATVLNGKQNVIEDLSDIRSGAELGSTAVQPSSLAEVATSGSYNDLLNKPTIPPAQIQSDWTQSDNTKVDYIKNKPTLATVATSGSYNDLINKPTFGTMAYESKVNYTQTSGFASVAFSGDYDDLIDKPTIPPAQVNSDWNASSGVSQILNKPNLATVATSGSYTDLLNKPTIPDAQVQSDWTESDNTKVDYIKNKPTLSTVATSGSYNDLSDKPSIPSSQVQSNWTEADSSKVDYIKNKPTLATVATTGSYSDLSDKPTIPSKTSDLNNDSGFITLSALSGYATETWVGQQGYITGITSSMVTTALGFTPYNSSNPNGYQENVIETVKVNGTALTPTNKSVDITVPSAQIQSDWNQSDSTKVDFIKNKPSLATVATSGSYNDLSNKPTIPSAQVNSDWDATTGIARILNKPTLSTVATSGSYNDLSDKPTIPSAQVNSDWDALSGVAQILNKPTLSTVATSGSYNDLSDKPTIPTKTSDLSNDSGYITGITSTDVTTALGYTPYNSTNPNNYQENVIETIKVNGSSLTPSNKAVDITVPSAVTETTVSGWGFTKNTGTVTSVNNISPVSGNVSIDLSVYQTNANLVTSVSSSSTDSQYPSAKCLYDLCGDIETLINAL